MGSAARNHMTNAAVETTVEGVQGQSMVVKYEMGDRSGEQKVLVAPGTPIVACAPGGAAN